MLSKAVLLGFARTCCNTCLSGQYCGTSGALHIFTSEDEQVPPDYNSFKFQSTVSLPVDTAATQGDGVHHDMYDDITTFDAPKKVKWAALCRGGGGAARDHLVLDYVELQAADGETCAAGACDTTCADLDADGSVSVSDLLILLASFGAGTGGDIDGNGETSVSDLLALLSQFGNSCTPCGATPGGRAVTVGFGDK
jgi:hypothetical protein